MTWRPTETSSDTPLRRIHRNTSGRVCVPFGLLEFEYSEQSLAVTCAPFSKSNVAGAAGSRVSMQRRILPTTLAFDWSAI